MIPKLPIVSVGIPTYNRPEGLRRTLNCITSQTYANIEIIVSDNCSDNENVSKVIDEFRTRDNRIIGIKQTRNIGAFNNFKFVLQKSSGTYFMWAADDDFWERNFIEELVCAIGDRSASFCNYSSINREEASNQDFRIFLSASGNTRYEQIKNFLLERVPSMIYGLYVREHLLWFLRSNVQYDWSDCFVIQKVILNYNGYSIVQKSLYKAGVRAKADQLKSLNPKQSRLFEYSPYMLNSILLIASTSSLSLLEKIKALFYLMDVNFRAFIELEKNRQAYWVYLFLYRVYNVVVPRLPYTRLY